ncbi:MAG: hypothetical protein U0167_14925 [bacterium]
MRPRIWILAVVLFFSTAGHPSSASQRWCGESLVPCCPQQSMGWMLYVDANHGAPDFWWTDSVTVQEIFRCEHGVQFLFVARQQGQPHQAALVFPKPSRTLLADRLNLAPGSAQLESEYAHYAARYVALAKALEDLSGGTLVEGARLSFQDSARGTAPIIVPKSLLVLRWRGQELRLRGYLDVYFSLAI